MNIRDAVAQRVRDVLEALAEGRCEVWMAAYAREALPSFRSAPAPRKAPIASVVHAETRQAWETVEAIHARKTVRQTCAARAGGCCEACGTRRGEALHMDHFWGRAREESVESCWMLCARCDRAKTESFDDRKAPSETKVGEGRPYWLELFGAHVRLHGYAEQETKVESALALERAQHREIAR